jgi:hypothetical protein
MVAVITGLVYVEECHDVAFLHSIAVDVGDSSTSFRNGADAYMAGNDRIRNACEFPVLQVNVSPAHL